MSDHVLIEAGCPPWAPSGDAKVVEVYHRFTIPLVGVLEQSGVRHLFWCVVGHAGPESAWAYAAVQKDALNALASASSETFDEVLRGAIGDSATVFAIASDDKGLTVSVTLDPPATFETAYERGMEELNQKIQEAVEEYQNLMERFPLMQVPHIAPSPQGSSGKEPQRTARQPA